MPDMDDERVQPALEAMLTADADKLRELIDADPELGVETWGDNTLLEWCTQPPHDFADEVIEVLIERSRRLDRALNLAGCWNQADLCTRLIAAGADPSVRADADITPLESAAMHGSTSAADVLVGHGLHRPSLWLAAAAGLTDEVDRWIDAGGRLTRSPGPYRPNWADVGRSRAPDRVADTAEALDRALIGEAFVFAAANDRLETAQLLLDRGADIDARPYLNTTALHFAIQFRKLDAVTFLLSSGARTDIEDHEHGGDAGGWAAACFDEDNAVTATIRDLIDDHRRRTPEL